jgi:hypothetical protein
MTQPASYQVPAHPSGLEMRTQLNTIVLAILGDNSGPMPPPETYPGMMWGDTTAQRLKRRTNANDGWVDIGPLDNFLGDIAGQISSATGNMVKKTGDTMTGALTVQADINLSGNVYAGNGNGQLKPDGNIWGTCYGSDYITNYLAGNYVKNHHYGSVNIYDGTLGVYSSSDPNGYGTEITPGSLELWTYNTGAYIDFKQLQTQDYVWRFQMAQNGSSMNLSQMGGSSIQFNGNSDVWCGNYGWIWSEGINPAKDRANDSVQKASGNSFWMGWGLRSSCVTINVDQAWNKNMIMSGDDRWYSMCAYDSRGFIAISIDGDHGTSGNRGIVTQDSDGRIKDIHGPSQVDALGTILQIPIIRYSFKQDQPEYNDGQLHECGFDAHFIKSIAPSMIFEHGKDNICNVYPNAGLAYCFKAIQQLFAILTDIKNELAEVKALLKAGGSQS